MKAVKEKREAFEEYEKLPASYHTDPRWKEVVKLRKEKKFLEANDLVFTIRGDYGFGG